MRVQVNSGRWTVAEHQGFLRGLEEYGSGNWAAISVFVPTRSPLQIEEHARQHFAGDDSVQQEEAQAASSSSPPSPRSRNGGGGAGGDGGNGSGPSTVAHLVDGVPATHQQEATGATASGDGGTPEQQQQQQQQQQPGEPIGNLMSHEIPYPNPLVWEEPALGEELRRYFGVSDYCGVL